MHFYIFINIVSFLHGQQSQSANCLKRLEIVMECAYVITTTARDEPARSSHTAVVEETPTTSNQRRCVGECARNQNVNSNNLNIFYKIVFFFYFWNLFDELMPCYFLFLFHSNKKHKWTNETYKSLNKRLSYSTTKLGRYSPSKNLVSGILICERSFL